MNVNIHTLQLTPYSCLPFQGLSDDDFNIPILSLSINTVKKDSELENEVLFSLTVNDTGRRQPVCVYWDTEGMSVCMSVCHVMSVCLSFWSDLLSSLIFFNFFKCHCSQHKHGRQTEY